MEFYQDGHLLRPSCRSDPRGSTQVKKFLLRRSSSLVSRLRHQLLCLLTRAHLSSLLRQGKTLHFLPALAFRPLSPRHHLTRLHARPNNLQLEKKHPNQCKPSTHIRLPHHRTFLHRQLPVFIFLFLPRTVAPFKIRSTLRTHNKSKRILSTEV
jgi:hypothetical protein